MSESGTATQSKPLPLIPFRCQTQRYSLPFCDNDLENIVGICDELENKRVVSTKDSACRFQTRCDKDDKDFNLMGSTQLVDDSLLRSPEYDQWGLHQHDTKPASSMEPELEPVPLPATHSYSAGKDVEGVPFWTRPSLRKERHTSEDSGHVPDDAYLHRNQNLQVPVTRNSELLQPQCQSADCDVPISAGYFCAFYRGHNVVISDDFVPKSCARVSTTNHTDTAIKDDSPESNYVSWKLPQTSSQDRRQRKLRPVAPLVRRFTDRMEVRRIRNQFKKRLSLLSDLPSLTSTSTSTDGGNEISDNVKHKDCGPTSDFIANSRDSCKNLSNELQMSFPHSSIFLNGSSTAHSPSEPTTAETGYFSSTDCSLDVVEDETRTFESPQFPKCPATECSFDKPNTCSQTSAPTFAEFRAVIIRSPQKKNCANNGVVLNTYCNENQKPSPSDNSENSLNCYSPISTKCNEPVTNSHLDQCKSMISHSGSAKSNPQSNRRRRSPLKRFRLKLRDAPNMYKLWSPDHRHECTWMCDGENTVQLKSTHLLHLMEMERLALQKIVVAQLQALQPSLGAPIIIPKDLSGKGRKRPFHLKHTKEKAKENKVGGFVFGIPLHRVILNDSILRSGSGINKSVNRCRQGSLDSKQHPMRQKISRKSSVSSMTSSDRQSSDEKQIGTVSCDSLSGSSCEVLDAPPRFPRSSNDSSKDGKVKVPYVMITCFQHLLNHGMHVDGIFRLGTSKKRVDELKERFDSGRDVFLSDDINPHDVASLLKEFLRDLPDPLLTRDLYPAFVACSSLPTIETQVTALRWLVSLLPVSNRDTLWYLMRFLNKVIEFSKDSLDENGVMLPGNRMNAHNLARVFSPNVLRQTKTNKKFTTETTQGLDDRNVVIAVFERMIDYSHDIFRVPADDLDKVVHLISETHPEDVDQVLKSYQSHEINNEPTTVQMLQVPVIRGHASMPVTAEPSPIENKEFTFEETVRQRTTSDVAATTKKVVNEATQSTPPSPPPILIHPRPRPPPSPEWRSRMHSRLMMYDKGEYPGFRIFKDRYGNLQRDSVASLPVTDQQARGLGGATDITCGAPVNLSMHRDYSAASEMSSQTYCGMATEPRYLYDRWSMKSGSPSISDDSRTYGSSTSWRNRLYNGHTCSDSQELKRTPGAVNYSAQRRVWPGQRSPLTVIDPADRRRSGSHLDAIGEMRESVSSSDQLSSATNQHLAMKDTNYEKENTVLPSSHINTSFSYNAKPDHPLSSDSPFASTNLRVSQLSKSPHNDNTGQTGFTGKISLFDSSDESKWLEWSRIVATIEDDGNETVI